MDTGGRHVDAGRARAALATGPGTRRRMRYVSYATPAAFGCRPLPAKGGFRKRRRAWWCQVRLPNPSEQAIIGRWPRGDWESQSRILLGRSSRLHCAVRARLRLLPIASESSCRMWRLPSRARARLVRTARQSTRTRARASRNVVVSTGRCAARKRRDATLEDQGIARN